MATATAPIRSQVVSHAAWLAAQKAFLEKEKEFTRQRDELARLRRELPQEKVDKAYVFQGPKGQLSLGDLFAGKSQLIVYHFMLAPDWPEGCKGCSFLADQFDGAMPHLVQRDVSFVVVSRAPLAEIEAFKKRMGWRFPWVSSSGSDFNYDYHVSFTPEEIAKGKVYYNYEMQKGESEEMPGASVFRRDPAGVLYHTYSTYARGLDPLLVTYQLLDLTPKGRNEEGLPSPMAWVRLHDRYEEAKPAASCCGEKRG
ncbi:MAG TPA: thioredoxin family protein [Gemmataceae bacterium]|jgi:predicted dithiol-disulfide oxidoreductase (DUF899 family)|nr:thioredoxin family protein [Gemmataceae bacterium]